MRSVCGMGERVSLLHLVRLLTSPFVKWVRVHVCCLCLRSVVLGDSGTLVVSLKGGLAADGVATA